MRPSPMAIPTRADSTDLAIDMRSGGTSPPAGWWNRSRVGPAAILRAGKRA